MKRNNGHGGNGRMRGESFEGYMARCMNEVLKFAERSDRRWEEQERRWEEQRRRWEEQELEWKKTQLMIAENHERVGKILEHVNATVIETARITVAALKDVATELRAIRRGRGNGRSNGR